MVDPAIRYVEAREPGVMGVLSVGDQFNFARAAARKDALVKQMADGIRTALRMGKVTLIEGGARFESPRSVSVTGTSGAPPISAESFIIATGTRWDRPAIAGIAPERVVTVDVIQGLAAPPESILILLDGPCDVPFGLEYATLLAVASARVSVVTAHARLLPGLDATVVSAARSALEDIGVAVFEGARITAASGSWVTIAHAGGTADVDAALVLAADVRKPFFETLGLASMGVATAGRIVVSRGCQTNISRIFAAGDVTGAAMLSSAASHMGEVAAVNATGGSAVTRLGSLPRILHTIPPIAWVGITEDAARAAGHEVATGVFDLSYNARAITLGARTGIVKVVAERDLGEILGVHAARPEAAEIVAVAASLMQAEATVHDLAAMVAWHPSITEGLIEAARRLTASL